ncbi:MAG: hypothetical protein VKJ09_15765, partial [Leptolyngbya sp.]|nr:hypothetical protein [Leptolyngbya sp.]
MYAKSLSIHLHQSIPEAQMNSAKLFHSLKALFFGLVAATMIACTAVPAIDVGTAADVKPAAREPAQLLWQYGAPLLAQDITQGGRGGEIVRVTSLASEGPGSLREAVSKS